MQLRNLVHPHIQSPNVKGVTLGVVLRDLGTKKLHSSDDLHIPAAAQDGVVTQFFWHPKMAATLESYVNRILLLLFSV